MAHFRKVPLGRAGTGSGCSDRSFLPPLSERKSDASLPTAREMLLPLDLEKEAPVGVTGSEDRLSLELVPFVVAMAVLSFGAREQLLIDDEQDEPESWVELEWLKLGAALGAGLGGCW